MFAVSEDLPGSLHLHRAGEARQGRSQEGHGGLIVAFVFLAAMTLISALGVVLSRNVVHSALFMSASFLGVAGFFVMLNAPALAAFQVLIYVGAVTVVILFGIMFTQRPQVRRYSTILNRQQWAGFLVAAIVVSRRKTGEGVDRGVEE